MSFTICSILICYSPNLFSQLKIGNNPALLNSNSALEIESGNKGLLLPRLSLNSTTSTTPLNNFVKGMFVFNLATENDVTPGLYYSDGTKWLKVNTAEASAAGNWSINGNTGISSNNFLGTINNAEIGRAHV